MDHTQHGCRDAQAAGAAYKQCECGESASPGPTPSPYPPSPMMPGPSMQSGGCGGAPGPTSGSGVPTQEGPPAGGGGIPHPGTGFTGYAHPSATQTSPMHHPPLHEAYHYGYYPQDAYQMYDAQDAPGYSILGLNLSDGNFWKGALIGAAVTLLVTNDTVQKTIMKGVATAYSAAQNGVGELKEKFEDAQAELRKPKE